MYRTGPSKRLRTREKREWDRWGYPRRGTWKSNYRHENISPLVSRISKGNSLERTRDAKITFKGRWVFSTENKQTKKINHVTDELLGNNENVKSVKKIGKFAMWFVCISCTKFKNWWVYEMLFQIFRVRNWVTQCKILWIDWFIDWYLYRPRWYLKARNIQYEVVIIIIRYKNIEFIITRLRQIRKNNKQYRKNEK